MPYFVSFYIQNALKCVQLIVYYSVEVIDNNIIKLLLKEAELSVNLQYTNITIGIIISECVYPIHSMMCVQLRLFSGYENICEVH